MRFVRFYLPGKEYRVGIVEDDQVIDLTEAGGERISSVEEALGKSEEIKGILASLKKEKAARYSYKELDREPHPAYPHLVIPFTPPEVWACGVTYFRSMEARESESGQSTVYDRVYHALRPEIFFKSTGRRVRGPNETLGLRSDSSWMVPEPELALVIGEDLTIKGFTIGNDLSCRDIEGENPLYLPQAKIFKHSCSLGPVVASAESIDNPNALGIKCSILRENEVVFAGEASTAQLKRTFQELLSWLGKCNEVYPFTVLLTGTCIVPPDEFTLRSGDEVHITIDGIGTLKNRMVMLP